MMNRSRRVHAGGLDELWGRRCGDRRHRPSSGELFSETNDNSVAILLTYGPARVLLAGDAEAREEEYMAGGPYTGSLTVPSRF